MFSSYEHCNLPLSWDKFCTTISKSAQQGKLDHNDMHRALLIEGTRRKSMVDSHRGDPYIVSDSCYDKTNKSNKKFVTRKGA